ncbi:regulator of G-protein signaling 16 [Astyanax mexicanus]|uniref:Regulator of G-protein signaling 16-like n=1 Tax=Astyanax mexicanus TaxID=7994 RepID=A0A8T2M6E3_ASTMX|nr:regulator of G-protein signaling 16 [Astyanax mexicanus]KAG9277265.1 regulator of G-protein signaling 16-like [Astyanax mexicanus]
MCRGLAALPNTCLERAKGLKARVSSFLDWRLLCYAYKLRKPSLTFEECLRWKESFEKLLSSKHGLYAFRAFLVSEFSEENIAFYLACENYRRTKSPAKLRSKAQRIYNEFIGSEAPREVNIDHETRDITQANVKCPTASCFDSAQYRIYILMEKDCYPRFLRSSAYRDLLSQLAKKNAKAATKKA